MAKAASLQGYDDVLHMYERGRAFSRELDELGSFRHLSKIQEA